MAFTIPKNTAVVFDLDDTLFKEIDYVKSAFWEISRILRREAGKDLYEEMLQLLMSGEEVFGTILSKYGIENATKEELLSVYRNHIPEIQLEEQAAEKLDNLKRTGTPLGLITDGRSVTQRNKLRSLGIEDYFDEILISEEFGTTKPEQRNFEYMQRKLSGEHHVYIGDNIKKDFIAPNSLGWETVCLLDDGSNIHPQQFNEINNEYQKPKHVIKNFGELSINSTHKTERVLDGPKN